MDQGMVHGKSTVSTNFLPFLIGRNRMVSALSFSLLSYWWGLTINPSSPFMSKDQW